MKKIFAFLVVALFAIGCGDSKPDEDVVDPGKSDVADVVDTPDEGDPTDDTATSDDLGEPQDNAPADDQTPAPDEGTDTNEPEHDPGQEPEGCSKATVFSGPSCVETAACEMACPGDEDFLAQCKEATSAEGLDQFNALRECMDQNECVAFFDGDAPDDCAFTNCKDQVDACMPEGTKTCRDIWMCRKACDPADVGCPAKCVSLGTIDDRLVWNEYQDCVLQADCALTDTLANGWPTEQCENDIQSNFCTNQAEDCFPPF
jgi:hypothetical protein